MRGLRQRVSFFVSGLRLGLPLLGRAVGLVFLVVGGTLAAVSVLAFHQWRTAVLVLALVVMLTFAEGAFRLHRSQAANLDALEPTTPRLSFGSAVIPPSSSPIAVSAPELPGVVQNIGSGRIIRVPVINAAGAGGAKHVHAQLTFLPEDREGLHSPKYPAQGEWPTDVGREVEVDLPGNDRPRFVDVLLVLDGQYPNAYEWTTASRAAGLRGYAIKSNVVAVDIEVTGSGSATEFPRLRDQLKIRLDRGMIAAEWASAGENEPTNWVAWNRN